MTATPLPPTVRNNGGGGGELEGQLDSWSGPDHRRDPDPIKGATKRKKTEIDVGQQLNKRTITAIATQLLFLQSRESLVGLS
ncbi:unnamed protein product [Linum tenue]|uniref:Uncharacterized protein n=1 Tax=Linum tenue TaxID=586396 RepID=A0AAV0H535_9ROSI|nr:unnamed protein product [Linum tenue]